MLDRAQAAALATYDGACSVLPAPFAGVRFPSSPTANLLHASEETEECLRKVLRYGKDSKEVREGFDAARQVECDNWKELRTWKSKRFNGSTRLHVHFDRAARQERPGGPIGPPGYNSFLWLCGRGDCGELDGAGALQRGSTAAEAERKVAVTMFSSTAATQGLWP